MGHAVDLDGIITGSDYDLFAQLWEDSLDSEANPPDEVRLGYAGYLRDPTTGLLLARHRWYDAGVGRWITRDPAGYVDGLSLYLYAKGNPFSLVDPMGLSGDKPEKKENERTAEYQYKHRNAEHHQYGSDYEGGNVDAHGFSDAVDRKRGEIHRHLYNDGDFEGTIVFPMYDDDAALNADQAVSRRDFFRTAGNIGSTLRMVGEAATALNPITGAAMSVSNFADDPSLASAAGVALAALPVAGKVVQGAAKEAGLSAKFTQITVEGKALFNPGPRPATSALRKAWEDAHPGKAWPRDPRNGKPLVADHIVPRAEGGKDVGENIMPRTVEEHTARHADDFKRWGGQRRAKPPRDEPK
ncbi:MAG: hypothetical protein JNL50_07410 [Phycisphaerae bacterium]|nr:hypothetical protein [Phycisphaerae bacterium]